MARLVTKGLKGIDLDIEIGRRLLAVGRTGSGKSSIAQGIVMAAVGYDPAIGKTEAATGQLLRLREGSVTFTADDGQWIGRTLRRVAEGQFKLDTRVSWITAKNPTEHAAAAVTLFGKDAVEAIEHLRIAEMMKLSGPQRSGKLLALIEAGIDAYDVACSAMRRVMMALANRTEAETPVDDYADYLRPSIPGYDADGRHTGQYAAVHTLADGLVGALESDGISGALAWAHDLVVKAQADIQSKVAAKREHEARLAELRALKMQSPEDLEARRSTLEREIGAAGERAKPTTARLDPMIIRTAHERATRNHKTAMEAREAFETEALPTLEAKRKLMEACERDAGLMAAPKAPDYRASDAKDAEAKELDGQADAIALPDITAKQAEIATLRAEHERANAAYDTAKDNPWRAESKALAELRGIIRERLSGPTRAAFEKWCEERHQYHLTQIGDVEITTLERAANTAHAKLRADETAFRTTKARYDAAAARQADLRQEANDARDTAQRLRKEIGERHAKALEQHGRDLAALQKARDNLKTEMEPLSERDKRTADTLREAMTALETADGQMAELRKQGDVPAQPTIDAAALETELKQVTADIESQASLAAALAEIERLTAETEKFEATREVCTQMEKALRCVRSDEVQANGGILTKRMDRFLEAAGRPERAYLKADKEKCEMGWQIPKGDPVPVAGLSGGEYALFTAALAAAVIALRKAPLRILLVEAAELDDEAVPGLLAGIDAVGDGLDHAIVMTSHKPATVPASWPVLELQRKADRIAA